MKSEVMTGLCFQDRPLQALRDATLANCACLPWEQDVDESFLETWRIRSVWNCDPIETIGSTVDAEVRKGYTMPRSKVSVEVGPVRSFGKRKG